MTAVTSNPALASIPAFCEGIQYFGDALPGFDTYGKAPVIGEGNTAIADPTDPTAAYQTLLYADALRYLILQMTASKASGHPGGFASQAEAYASLVMLGHKNIVTEVGHHAPGFYSAMFLDRSLEDMGITTVQQLRDRRWRVGRTLHHEFLRALPYRLSHGHQLSAHSGLERLFPGTPQHGVAAVKRSHDGILAGQRV